MICDVCNRKCKLTPFGSFVYICKTSQTLCIDCNSFRNEFEVFKRKYNVLKYLANREQLPNIRIVSVRVA